MGLKLSKKMPTEKYSANSKQFRDQNPVCLLWIGDHTTNSLGVIAIRIPTKPHQYNGMSGFWTPCLIDSMLIRKFVNLYLELQSSRVYIQGLLFSQVCQVSPFGFAGCACRLPRAPWTRIAGFLGRSMMGLPSQDVVHTKGGSSQDGRK